MSEDSRLQKVENQQVNQQAGQQGTVGQYKHDEQHHEKQDHYQDKQVNHEKFESSQQQDDLAVSQNMQRSQINQEEEEEEVKLISILDFNPDNNKEPILTSPRSLMACQITSINPKMLVKKKDDEIYKMLQYKSNLNEEGIKILSDNFEKRRLDKVKEVIKARENIINDHLTREDKKMLHESFVLQSNSQMYSQKYKSESCLEEQPSGFHQNEHLKSNMSSVVNARLEKTKYIQKTVIFQFQQIILSKKFTYSNFHSNLKKRQIETMIGNEIRTHKMHLESEMKDQRLKMIAEQKEIIRQRRREEFEENQKLKHQNLENLRKKDDILRLQKEQDYQHKQAVSNSNLHALKNIIQMHRQEESDKKVMIFQQIKSKTIYDKDELKRQKVEKKYLEKEAKFQQKQDLFQQHLQHTSQKRDDKQTKAYEKYMQQNQDNYERLEKNRQEQDKKQAAFEERQKMMEMIRQNQQLLLHQETMRQQKRAQSTHEKSTVQHNEENNDKKQQERDKLRENALYTQFMDKKIKQQETLEKRNMILQNEQQKKHNKFLIKSQAAIDKAERMQKEKQWFYQTQANLKLMKNLNAKENIERIKNQEENRNKMIQERLSQQEFRKQQRDNELQQATLEKEMVLRKIEIQKQKLTQNLGKLFQQKKEINVEEISKKYEIELGTEEQIMSRSAVHFE